MCGAPLRHEPWSIRTAGLSSVTVMRGTVDYKFTISTARRVRTLPSLCSCPCLPAIVGPMDARQLKEMLLLECQVPDYSPLYLKTLPELQSAISDAAARRRVKSQLQVNPALDRTVTLIQRQRNRFR